MSPCHARKTRNGLLCASALPIGQLPTDDIAVRPVRERRLERRRPLRVLVVDRDEPERACILARQSVSPPSPITDQITRTATKRDPLLLRRHPVRHPRAPHGVPESDHTRDSLPAVLAEPAVRPQAARARARAAVRRARVCVGDVVAREDGRGAVRVREREDVREGVDVRVGAAAQAAGVLNAGRSEVSWM